MTWGGCEDSDLAARLFWVGGSLSILTGKCVRMGHRRDYLMRKHRVLHSAQCILLLVSFCNFLLFCILCHLNTCAWPEKRVWSRWHQQGPVKTRKEFPSYRLEEWCHRRESTRSPDALWTLIFITKTTEHIITCTNRYEDTDRKIER